MLFQMFSQLSAKCDFCPEGKCLNLINTMEYIQDKFMLGNTSYSLLAYEEIYVDKEKLENDTHESV